MLMQNLPPRPHWQGSLDGLCGIYAVINAVDCMCRNRSAPLREEQHRELFHRLCHTSDINIASFLADGMTFRQVCRLLDSAKSYLDERCLSMGRRVAFRSSNVSLAEYWDKISHHININGPGSVLVGMTGQYDHWSVVRDVTGRQIRLWDSDDLNRVNRSRCRVGRESSARPVGLCPTQTVLLTLEAA